jgi:hypothetical protein
MRVRLDRRYDFALSPEQLWGQLTQIDEYPRWWPWLRRIEGDGFVDDGVTRVAVAAPVPWVLRLVLAVTYFDPGKALEADVSGDLSGTASIEVTDGPRGSTARIQWSVAPSSPGLRLAARLTYPLLIWGQDWVVAAGLRQFRTAVEQG